MNIFFVVIGILLIFNSISIGLSLTPSNRNCTTVEPTAIDDAECKKYYICIYDDTGSLVSYDTSCPTSMVFDPSIKNCVPSMNFVCKTNLTSATASTTTTTTSTTPRTTPTPCNGRFQIIGGTCQDYYFCYTDAVTTIKYNLTCPNNLQFNPITQKCVSPCSSPDKCPPCL
ncbi:probable endochitinase isoform X1 [Frieseomelitta varia]|uniref:probable endochitinase isoform X1 n=1 Tax=Frieseomelitta varia TaxID=561572 RepID=UPI001CB69DDC|nr:probable endochitinase isoform X1 [Frieseomelitta varia]